MWEPVDGETPEPTPLASTAQRTARKVAGVELGAMVMAFLFLVPSSFLAFFVALGLAWKAGETWMPTRLQSLLVPAVAMGVASLLIWGLWMVREPWGRVLLGGVLAGSLLVSAFFAVMLPSAIAHDQVEAAVRSAACASVPPGGSQVACDSIIQNPSNGNSCGYYVDIDLQTNATPKQIAAFYQELPIFRDLQTRHGLDLRDVTATARAGGLVRAEVVAVGGPGADLRCS